MARRNRVGRASAATRRGARIVPTDGRFRRADCLPTGVRSVRFHPDPHETGPHGPVGSGDAGGGGGVPANGRLNLLLSYAGWQDESWVDRVPKLLEPMGVSSHRARSGAEARRVIETIPIHIAVVDLGLPLGDPVSDAGDEGGPRLLQVLSRLPSKPPTVAVKRATSQRDAARELSHALRCGAFAVVDRPRDTSGLELMLEVLRRALVRFYQGRWPGMIPRVPGDRPDRPPPNSFA